MEANKSGARVEGAFPSAPRIASFFKALFRKTSDVDFFFKFFSFFKKVSSQLAAAHRGPSL